MEGVYGFELESLAEGGKRVVAVAAEGADPTVVEGFAALYYRFCAMAFLHHMAIVFVILVAVMSIMTVVAPRREPVTYPTSNIDVRVPASSYVYGALIVLATVALYITFR
jgi:uncharacterized sodium:solute symporter family permease YidK